MSENPKKFLFGVAMFAHLCVASKCIRRPPPRVAIRRNIATTLSRASLAPDLPSEAEIALQEVLEEKTHDSEEEELLSHLESENTGNVEEQWKPETFNEFLQSIGNNFKYADAPRKWLSGNEAVESVSPRSRWYAYAVG
jgi:hypothetical protein